MADHTFKTAQESLLGQGSSVDLDLIAATRVLDDLTQYISKQA